MPYPEEAVLVSNAVDARRREFTTLRHCARRAMREPGLPGTPYCPEGTVLPDGRPGPWEASRTVRGTGAPHPCAVRTSEADEMTSTPRLRTPALRSASRALGAPRAVAGERGCDPHRRRGARAFLKPGGVRNEK
ncbi:hypothetical protein [Streptomyces xantholiticus]